MPAQKLHNEVQFASLQDGRVVILKVPFSLMARLTGVDQFDLRQRNKHYAFALDKHVVRIVPRLREGDDTIPGWLASTGSRTLYFSIKKFMRHSGLDIDFLDGAIISAKIKIGLRTGHRRLVFELPRKAFRKVA